MDVEEEADMREQIFHNNVREQIIFLLLFILLYLFSFFLIEKFRRRDREDIYSTDEEEVKVYRISLWLCTLGLAVSLGSALLLPVSIVSNEVLLLYPDSYYVKWLNSSLIQGLWSHVFLFSNLSLFVLLPFAYLFTESAGLGAGRAGLAARACETCTVLGLLAVGMLGLAFVVSALIDETTSGVDALLSLWTYLPFLYSCVSFVGVLMLLVFTPLGFVRLFGVVSRVLVKPQFLRDLNEEYHVCACEQETLIRRMHNAVSTGAGYISPEPMYADRGELSAPALDLDGAGPSHKQQTPLLRLRNGALQAGLQERLTRVIRQMKETDERRKRSCLQRNVVYPLAMLLLLALTALTVLMVLHNSLQLLIGIKALPPAGRQFTLGITSLSKLGWAGATLEAFLILYIHAASLTGLCSVGAVRRLLPRPRATPLTRIIGACCVLLVHSTAAPPLVKILGITNFDLLGDFGRIEWLGNFRLVLLCNLVFASAATLCLVSKFTATVRTELYNRFKYIVELLFPVEKASPASTTPTDPVSATPAEPESTDPISTPAGPASTIPTDPTSTTPVDLASVTPTGSASINPKDHASARTMDTTSTTPIGPASTNPKGHAPTNPKGHASARTMDTTSTTSNGPASTNPKGHACTSTMDSTSMTPTMNPKGHASSNPKDHACTSSTDSTSTIPMGPASATSTGPTQSSTVSASPHTNTDNRYQDGGSSG